MMGHNQDKGQAKPSLLITAAFLLLLSTAAAQEPGAQSTLTLTEGELNGQAINPEERSITAAPGERVQGSVTVAYDSAWDPAYSAPLGYTPTWGEHETSFSWDGTHAKSTGTKTFTIDTAAPPSAGTYHLIFAYRAEIDAADVFSMTNWAANPEVWDDGNDVASLSPSQITTANNQGNVEADVLFESGMQSVHLPATAITVEVVSENDAVVTTRVLDQNTIPDCQAPFRPEEFIWNFGDGTGDYVKNRSTLYQNDYWSDEEQEAFLDGAMASESWNKYHHMYRANGTYTITCTAMNGSQEATGSTTVHVSTLATPSQLEAADEWHPYIYHDVTEKINGSKYRVGGYSLGLPHDPDGGNQIGYWWFTTGFYTQVTSVHPSIATITFPEPGTYEFFMDAGGWFYDETPQKLRNGFDFFGCSNPRTVCQGSGKAKSVTVPDLGTRDFFGVNHRHVNNTTYEFRCENYASDMGNGGRVEVREGSPNAWYNYDAGEWVQHTFSSEGTFEVRCHQAVGVGDKWYYLTLNVTNTTTGASCTSEVNDLPITCNGGTTVLDDKAGCRKVACESSDGYLQVLACDKEDPDNPTHFEIYNQGSTGNPPQICIADTCIQYWGYKRGDDYPYCSEEPTTIVCGNGAVETGEQCDDGNTLNGDGCSATCQVESIGAVCGNGIIETGEQCDDGNTVSDDGCSSTCELEGAETCYENVFGMPATCNGGTITMDEAGGCRVIRCDAPLADPGTTFEVKACDKPGSDDPAAFEFYEVTDNLNGQQLEICLADRCITDADQFKRFDYPICTENGAAPTCGDGVVESGEACDDGNTISGDGCSSTCETETGETSVELRIKEWYPQGLNYVFVCEASEDEDTYSWRFGDGNKQVTTTEDVYHTYEEAGEYAVTCATSTGEDSLSVTAR